MENQFFARPILNSPYDYPARHWELDESGQPTQKVLDSRRTADFVTPIPKPRRQQGKAEQSNLLFDEGKGLSSESQQYDHTAIINAVRQQVDRWRLIPDPGQWHVTPETARQSVPATAGLCRPLATGKHRRSVQLQHPPRT